MKQTFTFIFLSVILLITPAACGLRGKQIAGATLTLSTLPVNLAMDGTTQNAQIVRASATFALLATAVALFELDARRDRVGERVTLVYNTARQPLVGDYVQEQCDKAHVVFCSGPYQTYQVQAVRRLKSIRSGISRYALTTKVVDRLPALGLATVHPLTVRGPMAASAWDDAESTVETKCDLGCGDSQNTELQNEN